MNLDERKAYGRFMDHSLIWDGMGVSRCWAHLRSHDGARSINDQGQIFLLGHASRLGSPITMSKVTATAFLVRSGRALHYI